MLAGGVLRAGRFLPFIFPVFLRNPAKRGLMDHPPSNPSASSQFPCSNCGANLVFQPGTDHLVCPYCGTDNPIPVSDAPVIELDFESHVGQLEQSESTHIVLTVRCTNCGAESDFTHDVTAGKCPFCGTGIVAQAASHRQIKPASLLPFVVTRKQSEDLFKRWLHSLWFAPNDLKKLAERESGIQGVYIPAWTYDSHTRSDYVGERGDDYWTTESYTSYENGKPVRRTRQVRRTRWRRASGHVRVNFDDVLVLASQSLPAAHAQALEPWDLKNVVPYQDHYLSGFIAESYQVNLEQGFGIAKQIMAGDIELTIRRDIGGDHQRIHDVRTGYFDVTFKHTLLPLWISAYRYRARAWRFLVNARTGEVQGERPYSWIKITLAVLLALMVLLIVGVLTQASR